MMTTTSKSTKKVNKIIESPTTAAFTAKASLSNNYSYVTVSDSDDESYEDDNSSEDYNYNLLANDEDMNEYIEEQRNKMESKTNDNILHYNSNNQPIKQSTLALYQKNLMLTKKLQV